MKNISLLLTFIFAVTMNIMGQSKTTIEGLAVQTFRPECQTGMTGPFPVKINNPFKITWVMDETVEGFTIQIDNGAKLVIRPSRPLVCPLGTPQVGMYPYIYSKSTGLPEGKHIITVTAFNTEIISGAKMSFFSSPKQIEVNAVSDK